MTRLLLMLLAALLAAVLISGCGGSAAPTNSSASAVPRSEVTTSASAGFREKGSPTNNLVEFGHEAPPAEREAASEVLAENLAAREDANFRIQCATMALAMVEKVTLPKKGAAAERACPKALEQLAKPLNDSADIRADTLSGSIDALRVEGGEGNALYHGNDQKDYAIEMLKQGGQWMVGSITTTELNPPSSAISTPNQSRGAQPPLTSPGNK